MQLKSEQESKRQAEAQRKRVRRSQSNTRAQSVRRTSLRDKTLTTKKDAVEEARLRLKAQEVCNGRHVGFQTRSVQLFMNFYALQIHISYFLRMFIIPLLKACPSFLHKHIYTLIN